MVHLKHGSRFGVRSDRRRESRVELPLRACVMTYIGVISVDIMLMARTQTLSVILNFNT